MDPHGFSGSLHSCSDVHRVTKDVVTQDRGTNYSSHHCPTVDAYRVQTYYNQSLREEAYILKRGANTIRYRIWGSVLIIISFMNVKVHNKANLFLS